MILKLNQQKIELAYSIFLVILIPAVIIAGTIWLTGQIKSDFDQELRRKANLANEVFGVSATNILSANSPEKSATLLQQLIDQARAHAPEIEQLTLSRPASGGFRIIASSDTSKVNQADTTIQTQLAWSKGQAIASLIASGEGNDRTWLVATPLTGAGGQQVAVSSMRVSLRSSDELIGTTLRNSFIGLSVMLVVIILLMLNHFRFVEYAELFRAQKELGRMKDDFISIATHELKAPMSVIKGYLSMVLEEKDLPQNAREMTTIAQDQTNRLTRLVADLLDVSRLEQGKTKYNLAPVKLPDTITPMMHTFEVKAKDKNLGLVYQPPADLPAVMADPDRVSEIFTNLIDNAIKYSRTGTVTITHEVAGGILATTVADTGIGLTPDEVSHLFARFYRAKNDDTKDISGTGLGLWIIKQYAQAMGGDIVVESEKGKGSQFIVTLPLAVAPAAPPPSSGNAKAPQASRL
jgi:signal transduction histidine kinase